MRLAYGVSGELNEARKEVTLPTLLSSCCIKSETTLILLGNAAYAIGRSRKVSEFMAGICCCRKKRRKKDENMTKPGATMKKPMSRSSFRINGNGIMVPHFHIVVKRGYLWYNSIENAEVVKCEVRR